MTSHLDEGRIQELVDGEIPSSELPPIQAHLAACAECRARLDEARAIGAVADQLIETIELPDTPVRVAPRISRSRPRAWTRNLAWAATVVVAAGLGYVARSPGMPALARDSAVGPVPPATDLVTTPAETVAAIQPEVAPPAPSRRPTEAPHGTPAGRLAPERDKDLAGKSRPVPSVASAEREEAKVASTGTLQSLSPTTNSDTLQKKAAQNQPDPKLRLDELVVTGANEAKAAAPVPPPTAAARRASVRSRSRDSSAANLNRVDELVAADVASGARPTSAPPAVELTLTAARARLGGILRQIEGLAPLRVDALGDSIRVVYPLESGELHLVEWLRNGELLYRLRAPAGFPSDSLDRLRARVHD